MAPTSNGEQPELSVVLPVYNGAHTLSRAIASVQAQTFSNWELIVVDDGSSDASASIAQEASGADNRIRVLSQRHAGIVPALQAGCAVARGQFIARMDADDVSRPDRFTKQRAWFDAHPNGGLCGTHVAMVGETLREGRQRYGDWLNEITTQCDVDRELFIECPIAHPSFMMRRTVYEAVGGYRDFEGPEDYDLVFRVWQGGFQLGNIPEPLLEWHESPGRLSMTSPRYTETAFRRLKRAWLRKAAVNADCPLYQWGAGEVGKRWLREWDEGGIHAVVDIRPGKIGQTIHGYAVIQPDDLPPPGACYFLVAVGTPGARSIIRDWCRERGYVECVDFRFIA